MMAVALAFPAAEAWPITLPAGFEATSLPFLFDLPTALAFLPDGRLLVAEKGGIVYVVEGGVRRPMWVHEEEVLNTDDRGLLAIAVDPDFAVNRYVYFLYTVDPDSNGIELDHHNDAFGRLTRYQVSANDRTLVDESSRTVLIGRTWRDGFASGSGTHTVGGLAWGRDGSLLVSAGDGAHHEQVDAGGLDPGLFGVDRTDPLEDIGAFRAQDLGSLDGKVLRVDPATGLGYSSNPYFDGDPASRRSRVWAYGLRNPFRMAFRPGTGSSAAADGDPGTLYVTDVGWITWEEVNVARGPGVNFGWPCFEGGVQHSGYQAARPAHHDCGTFGTAENPALATDPTVSLHHGNEALSVPAGIRGGVVAGGAFYAGARYPSPYRGRYFIGDYARDWIKVVVTDDQDRLVTLLDFATAAERPVAFASDPANGDLHYAAIESGRVYRIHYTGMIGALFPTSAEGIRLGSPRPNPSRRAVALGLELETPAQVGFSVFDLSGRELWRGSDQEIPAGRSELIWPGLSRDGTPAPAGVYFLAVEVAGRRWTRRALLLP
jgi:glucose/arabinose dehydrogenase